MKIVNSKWFMVEGVKAFKSWQPRCVKKQRGDTILEVVIATAILSTVMVATFDILQRAVDTNLNIKNRVIALNIAREGIEATRNIRDTNWLKYSGDRRGKWLCHDRVPPDQNFPDACDPSGTPPGDQLKLADATYYTIDFSSGRYYLVETTMQSDIDFLQNQPNRETFRLYLTPTAPQRYTHEDSGNTETPFYRQIYLDIENPYDSTAPSFCNGDDPTCNQSRLKVISRVYWQEDGRQRSTTLEAHLFDFFERDEY